MFWKPLKERFGFVLVIAIAGFGTAVIAGNDVIAAAVAIFAGLAFLAVTGRQTKRDSDPVGDPTRRKGAPFTYLSAWELSSMPDLEPAVRSLAELGLKVDRVSTPHEELVLNGGSQLRTRLFGGYFIAPRKLPIQARLLTVDTDGTQPEVQLEVQDRLKIAVRDEALERRYITAAGHIYAAVEGALKEWDPRPVQQEPYGRTDG